MENLPFRQAARRPSRTTSGSSRRSGSLTQSSAMRCFPRTARFSIPWMSFQRNRRAGCGGHELLEASLRNDSNHNSWSHKCEKPDPSFDEPGSSDDIPGDDLLSHRVAPAVPSALEGLTSVFGMGTGVAPPLGSPGNCSEYLTNGTTQNAVRIFAPQ